MSTIFTPLFTGCITALVTPFLPDGRIDLPALRRLIDRQRKAGVSAIVLLGTTGEPCTLSMQEREAVISEGIAAAGHIPIIVGTGANNTQKAIEYAKQAAALGAAAQLSVTPYYNKCTQNGLIRHYTAIMDSSALPLIAYSVPSRTGMAVSPAAINALCGHPLFAGVKEAGSDAAAMADLILTAQGRTAVYCGNDDQMLSMIAMGACGVISVLSNLLPHEVVKLAAACIGDDLPTARALQAQLLPLIRALFLQVNPIPVKAALAHIGLIEDVLRLPLTPMEEPHRSVLLRLVDAAAHSRHTRI